MQRPNKPSKTFPLFANQNGQWSKKVRGKMYYFGSWRDDPRGAEAKKEYERRLSGIVNGTDHLAIAAPGNAREVTCSSLAELYLCERAKHVQAHELSLATMSDIRKAVERFVSFIGPDSAVSGLRPEHFAAYAAHLVSCGQRSRSRRTTIAYLKTMFRWGDSNEVCAAPKFGTAFKPPKVTKAAIRKEKARAGLQDYSDRVVTGDEVDRLLGIAPPNFKAMILLGVNCGLGPADIGRLHWRHINGKWLDYPRRKTGNDRRCYLWAKTRKALERVKTLKHSRSAIEREGLDALVFITRKQKPYYVESMENRSNAVSITFGRLCKKLDLKGVTFYRLRHTAKTYGKSARDRDALNLLMGHRDQTVADGYDHEKISRKRMKRVSLAIKRRLWSAGAESSSISAESHHEPAVPAA